MKKAENPASAFDKIKEIQHGIKHLVIENPEFLTYQAAAKYIGKSYGAIRLMIFRGYLQPIKSGGFRYLRTADLDAFMEGKLQNGKRHQEGDYEADPAASGSYPQAQKSLRGKEQANELVSAGKGACSIHAGY